MTNNHLDVKLQDKILLKDILERNYFSFFRQGEKNINLSFFNNPQINNEKYIPGYKDKTITCDNNIIISNLQSVLKWYNSNNFNCSFSISDNLLSLNLDFLNLILKEFQTFNIKTDIEVNLIISNNFNFSKFCTIFDYYKNTLNLKFNFIVDLNYYNIEELLILKDKGAFKILISPLFLNVSVYIENYLFLQNNNFIISSIIEETTDKWTNDKIQEYLNFIYFLLNKNSNIEELFNNTKSLISLTDLHIIDNENCKQNCKFQNSLNIFINNLSIHLCHNFQYDDQTIGIFILENEQIIDIEPKILELIILNTHLKRSSTPHCENCIFLGLCSGFCYSKAYTKSFNPIIPIKEYCNLKRIKYTFIFNYLIQNKLLTLEVINNLNISVIYKNYIIKIFNHLLKE